MTRADHVVDTSWREIDAIALEERVVALNNWLEHTEDMIDMVERDKELVASARSLAGLVRSRRNDLSDAAAKLRAEIVDRQSS